MVLLGLDTIFELKDGVESQCNDTSGQFEIRPVRPSALGSVPGMRNDASLEQQSVGGLQEEATWLCGSAPFSSRKPELQAFQENVAARHFTSLRPATLRGSALRQPGYHKATRDGAGRSGGKTRDRLRF